MPPPMIQGMNPLAPSPVVPMAGGQAPAMQAPGAPGPVPNPQDMPPNVWEQIMGEASQFATPEEKQAFIQKAMTDYAAQGQMAQGQMTRADALRVKSPEGRTTRDIYTAANPLEHISAALRNRDLKKKFETAELDLKTAATGADEARTDIASRLANSY